MEQRRTDIRSEVERVVNAAEADTAEALCRLSIAQQAFDRAARELMQRTSRVPLPPAGAREIAVHDGQESAESRGRVVPALYLRVFWLLVVALSSACFAVGFWFGRQAN